MWYAEYVVYELSSSLQRVPPLVQGNVEMKVYIYGPPVQFSNKKKQHIIQVKIEIVQGNRGQLSMKRQAYLIFLFSIEMVFKKVTDKVWKGNADDWW